MRTVNGRIRFPFRELAIGATFDFASKEDFPYSGFASGPWRKISARRYARVRDGMVCQVGSIGVEVIPEEQP